LLLHGDSATNFNLCRIFCKRRWNHHISQVIAYKGQTIRKIASTTVVQCVRNMCENTRLSYTYYTQSVQMQTQARQTNVGPQSRQEHGQCYTRQLPSAIANSTQIQGPWQRRKCVLTLTWEPPEQLIVIKNI
jgi:hypothetical protein